MNGHPTGGDIRSHVRDANYGALAQQAAGRYTVRSERAAARNIGRGIARVGQQAKEHGIKPGNIIRDGNGGTHEVSHVNGTTIHTTQGKMFHATKVHKIK